MCILFSLFSILNMHMRVCMHVCKHSIWITTTIAAAALPPPPSPTTTATKTHNNIEKKRTETETEIVTANWDLLRLLRKIGLFSCSFQSTKLVWMKHYPIEVALESIWIPTFHLFSLHVHLATTCKMAFRHSWFNSFTIFFSCTHTHTYRERES